MRRTLVLLLTALLLLASCTANQTAIIRGDGSGKVRFSYSIKPFIADAFSEMESLFTSQEESQGGKVFDLAEIRAEFKKNPWLELEELSSDEKTELTGVFSFSDVEEIFYNEEELTEAGIIEYRRENGVNLLRIHIDRENFEQLSSLVPELNSPFFELFGPMANKGVSEEEYLEMMEYTFEQEVTPLLRDSQIEAALSVDGTLISHEGGRREGNTVYIKIPVLELLLLKNPLDYSIRFR